jgi:hypothetical protein
MSTVKITELPSAASITSDDLLIIVDSGNPYVTKKISWKDIDSPQNGIIYGRKDGNWTDITSPANLQVRRGTAAEVSGIIPLAGEPVWTTDTNVLVIGDGVTTGGISIVTETPPIVFTTQINGTNSGRMSIPTSTRPNIVRITAVSGPQSSIISMSATNTWWILTLINVGSFSITILHQNGQAITDDSKIITPNGSNYTLAINAACRLFYDTAVQRWRVI